MKRTCGSILEILKEKWNKIYGGSISTVVDNSGIISLTYNGFISMVHRGTISMGKP